VLALGSEEVLPLEALDDLRSKRRRADALRLLQPLLQRRILGELLRARPRRDLVM
jgi:hypothetical protein